MLEGIKRRKFFFYKTKKEARLHYLSFRTVSRIMAIFSVVSGIFYPVLGIASFLFLLYYFMSEIYSEYMFGIKKYVYEKEFVPLMEKKHFLQLGYEIYSDSEDIEKLLSLLRKGDTERRKELARIAKYVKNNEPWRIVGVSKNILTRHLLVEGATGAGKTSLYMTAFKHAASLGAGTMMVDGKSDVKMFQKFFSLAVDTGRDHDVYCINFLKPDKTAFDTNTFSPLASLSAPAQAEFLAGIASTGGSGDMAYWEGRGKNLLMPIVYFYHFRRTYYGENYSFETVAGSLATVEFAFIPTVIFVMALAINEKLESDIKIKKLLKQARKIATPRDKYVPSLELLSAYMTQFPHRAMEVEKAGYSKKFIETLYQIYNMVFNTYLASVSTEWMEVIRYIGNEFYRHLKDTNINPLTAKIETLRLSLQEVLRKLEQEATERAKSNDDRLLRVLNTYRMPSEKDKTQHQYAQQQFDLLFQIFRQFSHVFGSLDPDIDMLDVIRNNKMLYVLLPALEQEEKTVSLLGKTILISIKSAISAALGGKLENLTNTQQEIINKIITPIPLGIVVLDEYGAYPVPGINVITAQARSINVSLWVLVQDYQSLRVGGKDEGSAKRVWANTSKIVMHIEDNETKRFIAESLRKEYVASLARATKLSDSKESIEPELSITKEEVLDVNLINSFKDGSCLMIVDGRPAYVQIFWTDQAEIDIVNLNRYEPVR